MNFENWEKIFENKISEIASAEDPAHDLLHFKRVVRMAKKICKAEGGILEVVVPAAWMHDFIIVPKHSPLRSHASKLSAVKAIEFLNEIKYPSEFYEGIAHAIEAHSFSANIEAKTLEAKIVQDADRLDGIGAIGIARCFATAGLMRRSFYSAEDPFCENRRADDLQFTVDHFYQKLFKTAETLKTNTGMSEALGRTMEMKHFLNSLKSEITP